MKQSYITVTDMFCGAGGSSQGAVNAGAEVTMAMNHWRLAIETHNTNFPDTSHDCADISAADPRRYPSTDILIASPECTNHSLAKGKRRQGQMGMFDSAPDPAAERSRATMWDVPRFAERHGYRVIIVENVIDAKKWIMWDAWLHAMKLLGYDHEIVYANSMFFFPTPQSRDRMYVVFWKGTRKPDLAFSPAAYCAKCGTDIEAVQSWKKPGQRWGAYRRQYVYRCPQCAEQVNPYYYPAATAIDWSQIGERIGDRARPLKPRTMERIRYGLEKFGRQPMSLDTAYTHSNSVRTRPASDPLMTQTARQTAALVVPFLMSYYSREDTASRLDGAMPTVTVEPRHSLVMPPFLTSTNYFADRPRGVDEPLPTQTTAPKIGITTPPFLIKFYDSKDTPALDAMRQPTDSITTVDHHGLVVPAPFLFSYFGERHATRGIDEPAPAMTSFGNHVLVEPPDRAFLIEYYNYGWARSVDDALSTVATHEHHGLVDARSVEPEDCYFRMLRPDEIGRAMAFPDEYVVLGNARDKVKQYGNAVTPPVMRWLMKQVMEVFN